MKQGCCGRSRRSGVAFVWESAKLWLLRELPYLVVASKTVPKLGKVT